MLIVIFGVPSLKEIVYLIIYPVSKMIKSMQNYLKRSWSSYNFPKIRSEQPYFFYIRIFYNRSTWLLTVKGITTASTTLSAWTVSASVLTVSKRKAPLALMLTNVRTVLVASSPFVLICKVATDVNVKLDLLASPQPLLVKVNGYIHNLTYLCYKHTISSV